MNTTIYLTRHGQTLWNLEKRLQGRGNSPLTEDGIERAKELRDRLKNIHIDIIYSSPIERAFETAKIIKGDKDIEIITDNGFMEMSFGDYEGRRTDEIMKENPSWDISLIMKGSTKLSAPNGENLGEVRIRVANTMDKIIKRNIGKTILIVAHGITLKAIMYYFKDKEVNSEVMGQATLTKINVDENNNFNIEFKNNNSHFTVKDQKLGW